MSGRRRTSTSAKSKVPRGAQEWLTALHELRVGEECIEAQLGRMGLDILVFVETLLEVIRGERMDTETVRVCALTFLGEEAALLLEDPLIRETAFSSLTDLAMGKTGPDRPAPSILVQGQALVTLTIIVVEFGVLERRPREFESFVDLCFEIISKVNDSYSRVLRGQACECLRELEDLFPGLLHSRLGVLLAMCEEEATHVAAQYQALFAGVLHNCVVLILDDDNPNMIVSYQTSGDQTTTGSPRPSSPPSGDVTPSIKGKLASGAFSSNGRSQSGDQAAAISNFGSQFNTAPASGGGGGEANLPSGIRRSHSSTTLDADGGGAHNNDGTRYIATTTSTIRSRRSITVSTGRRTISPHNLTNSLPLSPNSIASARRTVSVSGGGSGFVPTTIVHGGFTLPRHLKVSKREGGGLSDQAGTSSSGGGGSPNDHGSGRTSGGGSGTASPHPESVATAASSTATTPTGSSVGGIVLADKEEISGMTRTTSRKGLSSAETRLLKQVKRCLSHLVECAHILTPHLAVYVARRVVRCVQLSRGALSPSAYKAYMMRLAWSGGLDGLHLAIDLRRDLPDLLTTHDERLLFTRLTNILRDPTVPVPFRLLVLEWILTFPAAVGDQWVTETDARAALLHEFRAALFPCVFDDDTLVEAKLHALTACYATHGAPAAPPLLPLLQVFGSHAGVLPPLTAPRALFRVLASLWTRFPALRRDVGRYVVGSLSVSVSVVPYCVRFLDEMEKLSLSSRAATLELLRDIAAAVTAPDSLLGLHCRQNLHPYLPLLTKVACERAIDPAVTVSILAGQVRELCGRGSFRSGLSLLATCRSLLSAHPPPLLFRPLGELLTFIAGQWSDVVIRDRARQLLLLLTNVRGEKLAAVLHPTLSAATAHAASSLAHPGYALNASSASSVFPGPSRLGHVDPPFVEFAHVAKSQLPVIQDDGSVQGELNTAGAVVIENHVTSTAESGEGDEREGELTPNQQPQNANITANTLPEVVLSAYLSSEHETALPVCLDYTLSYDRSAASSDSSVPQKVYSLFVELSAPHCFTDPATVSVACLACHNSDNDDDPVPAQFPYVSSGVLELRPTYPVPVDLDVSTTFSTATGHTARGVMRPFPLSFADMLLPLRAPLSTQFSRVEVMSALFDSLWDHVLLSGDIANDENGGEDGHVVDLSWVPEGDAPGDKALLEVGASSVRTLNCPSESVLAAVRASLGPFRVGSPCGVASELVGNDGNIEANSDEHHRRGFTECERVGLFLHPTYHTLLHFHVGPESTVVEIRTDFWPCLPHVDDLLTSLC